MPVTLLLVIAFVALLMSRPDRSVPPWNSGDLQKHAPIAIQNIQSEEGRQHVELLYNRNCASCHGTELEGSAQMNAPSLLEPHLYINGGGAGIANTIALGRNSPTGSMPAFQGKLTALDITSLTLWLRYKALHSLETKQLARDNRNNSKPQLKGQNSQSPSWKISGRVRIAKSLLAKQTPQSLVYVMIKTNPEMRGPPFAAKRVTLAEDMAFEITNADTPMSGMAGPAQGDSAFLQVKLDWDGNPMSSEGEEKSEIVKVQLNGSQKIKPIQFN